MKVSTVTEIISNEPIVNVFSTAEKAKNFFAAIVRENDAEVESNEENETVARAADYTAFMVLDQDVI